tara:strand:+ start:66 stop:227 length:162 start_codon:yes stop_codon:yes gene_type:complete
MVLGGMHEGRYDEFIGIFRIMCLVSTVARCSVLILASFFVKIAMHVAMIAIAM